MKLAGKRLCFGAAALLTMAGVALAVPNLASAHNSGLRPTGDGGVGITSGPLCDNGSSNGSVTLYGPTGTTFTVNNGGGTWTVPAGQGYVEITGLSKGNYKAQPGNIGFKIEECNDGDDKVDDKKVYVCKYVGTPGVDERLQTGDNPINVSVNAIEQNNWNGIVPGWFSDAHDRSYVLMYGHNLDPEPSVDDCPSPDVPPPPPVDHCDPSQRPDGVSIGEWVPSDVKCVDITVSGECGVVTGVVDNDTPLNYDVVWSEDAADYTQFVSLPAAFAEDYNGGSVDVYYWIVGEEADYITGRDLPNFWEQNAAKVTVDTDCQDPPPPPVDYCDRRSGPMA